MSKLRQLRGRLAALRRARLMSHWGTGMVAIGIAVLVALGGLFALDCLFELNVPQRLLMFALAIAGVVWAVRKYALPFFQPGESIEALALQVEGQHAIQSDLIAALQFETPAASAWGSAVLEERVVARVAEVSPRLDVFVGFTREVLLRRVALLALLVAIAVVTGLMLPDHMRIFGQRLLLANVHYPTATSIQRIHVGGRLSYEKSSAELRPDDVKLPQGQPVTFIIAADGATPDAGFMTLRDDAGHEREIVLDRIASDDDRVELAESTSARLADAYYIGTLPRLIASVDYQVFLGDAWTDRASIDMIGLPVLEIEYHITPPDYAAVSNDGPRVETGSRRLSVLEGSSVEVIARCVNGKPLENVSLSLSNPAEGEDAKATKIQFVPGSEENEWKVSQLEGPLAQIDHEVQLSIDCLDEDGLSLEAPLTCWIRLEADRPPTAVASVVHRVVLPDASPVVEYRTADDYAIASIKLLVDVEREAGDSDASPAEPPANTLISSPDEAELIGRSRQQERHELVIGPAVASSVIAGPWPHGGKYSLDLSPFSLVKGDHIKLTLQVTDYRGTRAGETTLSDPIIVEVSDESGVLAAISEADRRSEERLNELIKRQLGIGESP